MPEKTVIEGTVQTITFCSQQNMFTVARLLPLQGGELVTVIGSLPPLQKGEQLIVEGEWKEHPRYGKQFEVNSCKLNAPVTKAAIERFLASGLIKGVGPVMAGRLVDAFGDNTLKVIEENPEKLQDIEGIGPLKAAALLKSYQEQRSLRDVMLFLQEYGISPGYALRIYRHYGDQAPAVLKENPYRIAEDVFGFGFITADQIAQRMGIPKDSPYRLASGLLFSLEAAAEDGHLFLPRKELLHQTAKILSLDDGDNTVLLRVLDRLLQENRLIAPRDNGDPVYLRRFYIAEERIASKIAELRNVQQRVIPLEKIWAGVLQTVGLTLAPEQEQALRAAWEESVMVVTGGPGTGKTTTVKALIALFREMGLKISLAAPTGRASRRLADAAGLEAKTIHRLLEYGFNEVNGLSFQRNVKNPLTCQVLIVDEVSMVDLLLFDNLLMALKPGTRLLLVGDVDQLPSVGAGNVLKELLDSGVVPSVRLRRVFRQARESMIIVNAHRINSGEFPFLNRQNKDFFFLDRTEPHEVAAAITELVTQRVPSFGDFDPLEDIQVLTPMRRTVVGVEALNENLQAALNPPKPEKQFLKIAGYSVYAGDRVMQIRNNYRKEVFNGDVGRILSINSETGECIVDFPDMICRKEVVYESDETNELTLAYAISVHKSQGSEYPVVIMPVVTQHYIMLQRNLLYTAVTRAKKMVVLVGSKKAVALAVKNHQVSQRYSRLAMLIAGMMKDDG